MGLVILTELAGTVLQGGLTFLPPLLMTGLIRLGQMGGIVWYFNQQPGGSGFPGLEKKLFLYGLKQGVFWACGFGMIAGIAGFMLYLFGINSFGLIHISLPGNIPDIILLLVVGGIIGPVAEELVFRGIIYNFLRKWGMAPAIIGSTALFAAPHSGAGIIQIIGGLVFAVAYEKEKSLVTPMVVHITGNFALFGIAFLSR